MPASLDCLFLIAPSVFSNVYLVEFVFVFRVMCCWCLYLWIVHFWLPLWYSLTFIMWIMVITKLSNSEQSYKGKVKTHKYINRQNKSTTGNCENRNDPDLVQAFLKKWWVESDFKAPNPPFHYTLIKKYFWHFC